MKTSTNRTLEYRNINLPSFDKDQLKEIEYMNSLDDSDIDLTDIPELTDEQLKLLHPYYSFKSN